jgi:hypothetical protein
LKQSGPPAASLEKNFSSFLKHGRKIAKSQAAVNPKSQGKESVKSTLALGGWPDAKTRTSKFLPYLGPFVIQTFNNTSRKRIYS